MPEPIAPRPERPPGKSLRTRLNEATVVANYEALPAELGTKLAQVKYAERPGLEDPEIVDILDGIAQRVLRGEEIRNNELDELSGIIGVEVAEIQNRIVQNLINLQEQLIHDHAEAKTRAGWVQAAAYLGTGLGLTGLAVFSTISAPWLLTGGLGFAGLRLADAIIRSRRAKKIEAQVRADLAKEETPEGPVRGIRAKIEDALRSLTCMAKQMEIEGIDQNSKKDDIIRVISEHADDLPDEYREIGIQAEIALLNSDLKSKELMEKQQNRGFFERVRENSAFRKIDGFLRGGRNASERVQTTTAYLLLGTLARLSPVLEKVSPIWGGMVSGISRGLIGMAGQSVGNLASQVVDATFFRGLKRISAADLSGEGVDEKKYEQARAQLNDQEWVRQNQGEAAQIREVLDQREQEIIHQAEDALEEINAKNEQRTADLRNRRFKKGASRFINFALRVGGAYLGFHYAPDLFAAIKELRESHLRAHAAPEVVPTQPEPAPAPEPAPQPTEYIDTITGTKGTDFESRSLMQLLNNHASEFGYDTQQEYQNAMHQLQEKGQWYNLTHHGDQVVMTVDEDGSRVYSFRAGDQAPTYDLPHHHHEPAAAPAEAPAAAVEAPAPVSEPAGPTADQTQAWEQVQSAYENSMWPSRGAHAREALHELWNTIYPGQELDRGVVRDIIRDLRHGEPHDLGYYMPESAPSAAVGAAASTGAEAGGGGAPAEVGGSASEAASHHEAPVAASESPTVLDSQNVGTLSADSLEHVGTYNYHDLTYVDGKGWTESVTSTTEVHFSDDMSGEEKLKVIQAIRLIDVGRQTDLTTIPAPSVVANAASEGWRSVESLLASHWKIGGEEIPLTIFRDLPKTLDPDTMKGVLETIVNRV